MRECLIAFTYHFLTLHQHIFRLWFHAWNLLYATLLQRSAVDVSLISKDSDIESENLSLLIRLSVSDDQKTEWDSSKEVLFIGIKLNKTPFSLL